MRGDLVETKPESQIHRLECCVELSRIVTHITHGSCEHAEPVEWNHSTGRVDHHVLYRPLPSQHSLGRVGRATRECLSNLD